MAKGKRKKVRILKLALTVFFVYVIASFVIMQADISHRKAEIELAKAKLDEQKYINEEITTILNSGDNKEYIMRMTREKLEMVFPNERVFVDINGNN